MHSTLTKLDRFRFSSSRSTWLLLLAGNFYYAPNKVIEASSISVILVQIILIMDPFFKLLIYLPNFI